MRRFLLVYLATVLPLAAAGEAAAKEVVAAKVCGASDCRELTDRAQLMALQEGGPPTGPPAKRSEWYRADVVVAGEGDDRFRFELALIPDAGLMRGEDGTWMPVSKRAARLLREATRGLQPFPAKELGGLEPPGPAEARVDEVVVIDQGAAPSSAAPLWPWLAGACGLLLLGVLLAVRRRRRRHSVAPAARPAEGQI